MADVDGSIAPCGVHNTPVTCTCTCLSVNYMTTTHCPLSTVQGVGVVYSNSANNKTGPEQQQHQLALAIITESNS